MERVCRARPWSTCRHQELTTRGRGPPVQRGRRSTPSMGETDGSGPSIGNDRRGRRGSLPHPYGLRLRCGLQLIFDGGNAPKLFPESRKRAAVSHARITTDEWGPRPCTNYCTAPRPHILRSEGRSGRLQRKGAITAAAVGAGPPHQIQIFLHHHMVPHSPSREIFIYMTTTTTTTTT